MTEAEIRSVERAGGVARWSGEPEGYHGAYIWADQDYVYLIESIGTDDTQISIPIEQSERLIREIRGAVRAARQRKS